MVISKKRFQRFGLSRGRMAYTPKYPIFHFFLFHYFLVPLADKISAEPLLKVFKCGLYFF